MNATVILGAVLTTLAGCLCVAASTAASEPPTGLRRLAVMSLIADGDLIDDARAVDCLSAALQRRDPRLEIVPGSVVRDRLYPWLEYGVIGSMPADVLRVFGHRMIRERARQLDMRWLVILTQFDKSAASPEGPMICGAGYGGGGCLGLLHVEREARIAATIWDLDRMAVVAEMAQTAKGRDYWIGYGIPIPILDATRTHACNALAAELLQLGWRGAPEATPKPAGEP